MTPQEILDQLITEWLEYKARGWSKVAQACYISARNYAAYQGLL